MIYDYMVVDMLLLLTWSIIVSGVQMMFIIDTLLLRPQGKQAFIHFTALDILPDKKILR